MHEWFSRFTRVIERAVGSPWAFVLATLSVVVWAATGPLFGYSDTWQLVINTGTTVLTFLIVFIIQSTQSRDMAAVQLKLDELIRIDQRARNELVDLEDRTDKEIEAAKRDLRDRLP